MERFRLAFGIVLGLVAFCLLMLIPMSLLAQATGVATPADPATLVGQIVQYFSSGSFALGASAVIMLLTYLLGTTLLQKWIPTSVLPWISMGLGVVSCIIASIAGGMVWWKAILNGVFVGNAASGLWSAIGQHILPQRAATPEVAHAALAKTEAIVAKVQAVTPEFVPKTPSWVAK